MCERCWTGDPERDAKIAQQDELDKLERSVPTDEKIIYQAPLTLQQRKEAMKKAIVKIDKMLGRQRMSFKDIFTNRFVENKNEME